MREARVNRAIISLGSNIDPENHIRRAKASIKKRFGIIKESGFVWTKPVDRTDQPDFLNGVLVIYTELECVELRRWLTTQEDALGRVRGVDKFGPRTIDLDVIVWNEEVVDDDVYTRSFLREALDEVCPGFLPQKGRSDDRAEKHKP